MKRAIALVFSVFIAAPLLAGDWPGFRGPGGLGVSDEKGLPTTWSATENVAWKVPIPGAGWSSPTVVGHRVFVATATDGGKVGRILAFAADTGKPLWESEPFPIVVKMAHQRNSQATATPVADRDRVYTVFGDGTFVAIDAATGKTAWTNREFPYYSQHGLGASPVLYQNLIIMPFDGSSDGPDKLVGWQKSWDKARIVAIDKSSGHVKWTASRGQSRIAHATPVVTSFNGKDIFICPAGDVVQGFDAATGALLWTVRTEGEGLVPSAGITDGLTFATTGFGNPFVKAIKLGGRDDVTKTHVAWQSNKNVPSLSSLLAANGRLYVATDKGQALCLKASDGKVLWQERLGNAFSASPILADGHVYFLADDGETHVVKAADEFEAVAHNALGEPTQCTPAISGGRIFLRTKGHLWCIGK
jgi:outer membrane protein assembly factor BamB